MERRETVSVNIEEIEDCVRRKIYEQYPYLKDEDVREVNLRSNVKFLLFEVVRTTDLVNGKLVKGNQFQNSNCMVEDEKVKNWEKFKKGELGMKKDGLELEKIGTLTGTYIIEGNLAYIEQEEEGKVTVVTASGIRETVPINELETFIKTCDMHDDIREELGILVSKILKK